MDFRFSNAHITYTITHSINDIQEENRSIEQNIDGVLIIPRDEFPYIYESRRAPLDPIGMELQMKCRIIPQRVVPSEIRNLFERRTKNDNLLVDNLIVSRKKASQRVEFNWDKSFSIDDKQYVEISYFEMEPDYVTLSDTREKMKPLINDLRKMTFKNREKAKEKFYELIKDEEEEIRYMELEEKSPIKKILPSIEELTTKERSLNLFIFKSSSFLEDM